MNSHHRIFRGRHVVPTGLIVLGIMAACGDSGSEKGQNGALDGLGDSGGPDVGRPDVGQPDAGQVDSAQPDAGQPDARADAAQDASTEPPDAGPVVFRPSNLPADICNPATTKDLVVPAGESVSRDTDGNCDRVIPQGPGLQDICVHIYSTVKIAGGYSANYGNRASAIVATKSFTLESGGMIGLSLPRVHTLYPSPGADARGNGTDASSTGAGGGGGGQMNSAGAPGGGPGGAGGPRYGDPSGRQLIGGGYGGWGTSGARPDSPRAIPGAPGAAFQIVSCGEFTSAGTIDATGTAGEGGTYSQVTGGGGSGGGAGGMILIEAASVAASGGKILARGGDGGWGGQVLLGTDVLLNGAPGGRGGTGASPPTAGETGWVSAPPMPPGYTAGSGGGGGAVGRILINVPRGSSPILTGVEIDPPAVIGTTH